MKRFFVLFCAVLLLCGCAANDTPPTEPTAATRQTAPTAATAPTQTASVETLPAGTVPYTRSLDAAVPIFDGPGYDESYLRVVGTDGVYTIVEEVHDAEGNRWGLLRSGLGWIDLTALENTADAPLTAAFADDGLLNSGSYLSYTAEESAYTVRLAFRAREPLTDLTFSLLASDTDAYTVQQTLYTLPELTPGTPLVTGVVFYGDLTAYGLSFTDADGTVRHYAVTISGRNGALLLEEYTL